MGLRQGRVIAVSLSKEKGTPKENMPAVELVADHGVRGDAHAGPWHRQVSLLQRESIDKMTQMGFAVAPGDFAENITTEGIDLVSLPVGTRLAVGNGAVVEITQKGKECHSGCAVFRRVGECIMPREGIFARVLAGGEVRPGDEIRVIYTMGIVTASDKGSRGEREDVSGRTIAEMLRGLAWVASYKVLPDDEDMIREELRRLADKLRVDLVVTTGGTGLAPRDRTPEATRAVIDREVPGIAELIRLCGMKKTPAVVLTRGIAGLRGKTLIINLPGSPKAVRESLEALMPVLPHAIEVARGEAHECARGD
ncbi:MAG TPA: MOSC domain-containing protein [Firmicutes bacterium]|nr:MOSC domain-containing protein [Bacillota bacterium]